MCVLRILHVYPLRYSFQVLEFRTYSSFIPKKWPDPLCNLIWTSAASAVIYLRIYYTLGNICLGVYYLQNVLPFEFLAFYLGQPSLNWTIIFSFIKQDGCAAMVGLIIYE